MADAPVELKVKVGAVAATLSGLVLAGLADVVPSVPEWVSAPVLAVVTGAVTFGAGWLAKHTPRSVASVTVDTSPTT